MGNNLNNLSSLELNTQTVPLFQQSYDVIFQVGISLLKEGKANLLDHDIEGMLKVNKGWIVVSCIFRGGSESWFMKLLSERFQSLKNLNVCEVRKESRGKAWKESICFRLATVLNLESVLTSNFIKFGWDLLILFWTNFYVLDIQLL